MREQEEQKSHWKSNHLLSRLRNPFKHWNFTIFKTELIIPQKKNASGDWVSPAHMASIWWYLGFAKLSSVFTTSDTNLLLLVPSLLIECNLHLRLGAWVSNYTPADRSGLHTSLSSYALCHFWFWDCTNCWAVPSSWAGTLKPLVVWSNQDTVTWNLCDANVFVGCDHPLGRNSVGHTTLSPSDQKNL